MGSPHQRIALDDGYLCSACCQHMPFGSGLKQLLASECKPQLPVKNCLLLSQWRPTKLQSGVVLTLGRHVVHATHSLVCYKGLWFCDCCGYFATHLPRWLVAPCAPRTITGQSTLRAIHKDQLPQGLPDWPSALVPVHNMVELEHDDRFNDYADLRGPGLV